MRITISKENLNSAINAAQKAINPKSIIPLYSCIKLDVRGGVATFMGAGLDISIECDVPVQTEQEGSALIPSRYFGDIVRRLPDIPITLEHSESMELSIRYDKSIFTLRTMSEEDFPTMPKGDGDLSFSISADELSKLIRQSSFAASTDELKGVFTGILWEIDGQELSLVGTDTHRLAWAKGQASGVDEGTKGSFIIPARIVSEIGRLIQGGDCQVRAGTNSVFFSFDNIRMNCHILKGAFPNYRTVIPSQFVTTIHMDSKALRDATERISLFSSSNDTSNTIYMEAAEDSLEIHSQSEIGYGRENIAVQKEGEDINIAFNSRYITDVFKAIDAESVSVQLSGQLSAGIIKDIKDDAFLYLVLPVKV